MLALLQLLTENKNFCQMFIESTDTSLSSLVFLACLRSVLVESGATVHQQVQLQYNIASLRTAGTQFE